MRFFLEHRANAEIVTGLIYLGREAKDLHAYLKTVNTPLNALTEKELCPNVTSLQEINASLR